MDIEFPQVVNDRREILLGVLLVQDDTGTLEPVIFEVMLYKKGEMALCAVVNMIDSFEVEDVAIIP